MTASFALLALVLAACGKEPKGVPVGEADASGYVAPRPQAAPLDTVYADSGLFADPALDSLRADSTRLPSVAPPPDFRAVWPVFRAAAERRNQAALDTLAALPAGRLADVLDGPFREKALALRERDFRHLGTAREATVTVGFDAGGTVVPVDEAERDASLTLRFDVEDGAYRLVGLTRRGSVPRAGT